MRRVREMSALALIAVLGSIACEPMAPPGGGTTQTRFPIVLAEGLFGFNFFGIPEDLRAGGATVFTPEVNPFSDSVTRGQQLLDQIDDILATSGAQKVNLVAHSQGGLDARFILGTRPAVLASITQLGTPNLGSPVADALLPSDDATLGLLGGIVSIVSGTAPAPADFRQALQFLSTQGTAQFNQMFPAGLPTTDCGQGPASVNGVRLFSFAGNTAATNPGDITDFVLPLLALNFPANTPNDALVGVCSAHFGTVVMDNLTANHLDLVNQFNGAVGATNIIMVYRMQAGMLKALGL
jgi:triacylglycerol lipase